MSDQQIKNHFSDIMYYKGWDNFCSILSICQILTLKYPINWIENNLDRINSDILKRNIKEPVLMDNYQYTLKHFNYFSNMILIPELEFNIYSNISMYSIHVCGHMEVVKKLTKKELNLIMKHNNDYHPTIYKITDNSFGESLKLALQYEKEKIKNTK